jgi:hypothetical protein
MTDNDFQSVYDELIETPYGNFNVILELSRDTGGELHWDVMASFYEGRRINARGNLIQCAIEQAERKVSADEN